MDASQRNKCLPVKDLQALPQSNQRIWFMDFYIRSGTASLPIRLLSVIVNVNACRPNSSGGNLSPSLGDGQNFRAPRWLFLAIDQVFRIFPDFPNLYFVWYRTQPFPRKKNTFFPILAAKNFFSHPTNTTSQNIGGDEFPSVSAQFLCFPIIYVIFSSPLFSPWCIYTSYNTLSSVAR